MAKKLTTKDLVKIGLLKSDSRLRSRRFIVPDTSQYYSGTKFSAEITIPENATLPEVLTLIYKRGIENGIEQGKYKKAAEIVRCLNLKPEE